MPPTDAPRILVRSAERGTPDAFSHPYNPSSEIHGWTLAAAAGLTRIGVSLAWLPPGKESFAFHRHHREEEWMFVLSGSGTVDVDDASLPVGPGDFLGFPPGVAHLVRNTGTEDLHFLQGGESFGDVEVADFPRLRRRMVRTGHQLTVYPLDAEVPFLPPGVSLPPPPPRPAPRVLVRAADRGEPRAFHHPENPAGEVHLTPLSRPAGLSRVAVVLTRVPAGRDAYAFHVHQHDEEWLYVLSGRGEALVGDAVHAIGPGDFLGFPPRGPGHDTRALPGEDLVYLCGGDAWSRSTIENRGLPAPGPPAHLRRHPRGAHLPARVCAGAPAALRAPGPAARDPGSRRPVRGRATPLAFALCAPAPRCRRYAGCNPGRRGAAAGRPGHGRGANVKRIEAIIRPSKLEDAKRALAHPWIAGITAGEVKGYGRQRGHVEVYRGAEYATSMVPKIKIEIVVPDPLVPRLVGDLADWLKTGKIGDGKIFVTPVDDAVRVRTGERGEAAL
ncbi:MAG: P-II family nitrogen regulator [Anaeromyxobacter sp.]